MLISLHRPLPQGVGLVSQWFGERPETYARFGMAGHNGIDYFTPTPNIPVPILAAHGGRCEIGWDPQGFGNFVRVLCDEYATIYAHLREVHVRPDQMVDAQTILGIMGTTGFSTGVHLHFGLKLKGMINTAYRDWIDPVPFRDI